MLFEQLLSFTLLLVIFRFPVSSILSISAYSRVFLLFPILLLLAQWAFQFSLKKKLNSYFVLNFVAFLLGILFLVWTALTEPYNFVGAVHRISASHLVLIFVVLLALSNTSRESVLRTLKILIPIGIISISIWTCVEYILYTSKLVRTQDVADLLLPKITPVIGSANEAIGLSGVRAMGPLLNPHHSAFLIASCLSYYLYALNEWRVRDFVIVVV